MTKNTLITLHPNEYTERLDYYLFAINLEDAWGIVILLMINPIQYVFQTKQKS